MQRTAEKHQSFVVVALTETIDIVSVAEFFLLCAPFLLLELLLALEFGVQLPGVHCHGLNRRVFTRRARLDGGCPVQTEHQHGQQHQVHQQRVDKGPRMLAHQ